jgi:glutaredoxin
MGRSRTGKSSTPRVLLYTSQGCAHCRRAKAFLEARQIPFSELDVGRSPKARKALQRLGARGVPTLLVGDQRLDGFSERAFLDLYERATHGR